MIAFLHVPKTAGTSVRFALEKTLLRERLVVLEREEAAFHIGLDEYRPDCILFGHISWQMADLFGAKRRIVILRDPIARCISQVQHWLTSYGDQNETDDGGQYQRIILPERGLWWNVENLLSRPEMPQFRALSNAQTAQLARHHIDRPDVLEEEWLRLATAHLAQCDIVGFAEALETFADAFERCVGSGLQVGRLNAGAKQSEELVAAAPSEVIRKLIQANEFDVELFCQAQAMANVRGSSVGRSEVPARRAPPRTPQRPLAYENYPGRLKLRLCHFLIDVAEAQGYFGVVGGMFLDRMSYPREAVLIEALAGREATVWTGKKAADLLLYPDIAPVGLELSEAHDRPGARYARPVPLGGAGEPLRIAIVEGRGAVSEVLENLNLVVGALAEFGLIILTNAIGWAGSDSVLGAMRATASVHGVGVAAYIDTHALFCRGESRWFYHAMLRAKFSECEIIRTRVRADEVLSLHCDY